MSQDLFYAMATTDLAEVALASGDFSQSQQWLLKSIEPSKGHFRRSIIFLLTLAGYLAFSPDSSAEDAARFLGAVDALSERSGAPLGSLYLARIQKHATKIRGTVSESQWQIAYQDGKSWGKETAFQHASRVLAI